MRSMVEGELCQVLSQPSPPGFARSPSPRLRHREDQEA